ncbi:MAG: formylglycine-generating enzyme family protein [Planctomycetota bacterium]|nr:MAG: formylglycine-generating enzyme family protein [Planctomycetota bacterium]
MGWRASPGRVFLAFPPSIRAGRAAISKLLQSHPLARGAPPPWASAWGEDKFGPWAVLRVGEAEQRMRWIRPGRFLMGSAEDEEGRNEDEGPQHWVRIPEGFWFGEMPCTQALWLEVMGENPSHFVGKDHPVEQVSWDDCQGFFEKLEAKLGNVGGFRLPKEAEWEYACRAGTTEARYDQDLDSIAWYSANSEERTYPVGEKKANPWGLYDMLGNVLEWCGDVTQSYAKQSLRSGPVEDPIRVIRGGSWNGYARQVRAAYRGRLRRVSRWDYLGFRLAWN